MTAQPPPPTGVAAELATLRRIAAALERLDVGAQVRVVAWIWERYMGAPHVVSVAPGREEPT
jgi:hypothetical protein